MAARQMQLSPRRRAHAANGGDRFRITQQPSARQSIFRIEFCPYCSLTFFFPYHCPQRVFGRRVGALTSGPQRYGTPVPPSVPLILTAIGRLGCQVTGGTSR